MEINSTLVKLILPTTGAVIELNSSNTAHTPLYHSIICKWSREIRVEEDGGGAILSLKIKMK